MRHISWLLMTGSSDSSIGRPSAGTESLALVRLTRWHQLSLESLSLVKKELALSLGLENHSSSISVVSSHLIPSSGCNEDIGFSKLSPQLRHLIMAGAPWHLVAQALWQEFNLNPDPLTAAKILELAFVQAAPSETLDTFSRILVAGTNGFYWFLHPKLRDFIVEHAPEQHIEQIYWLIAREQDESKLSGLEHAFIFLRAASSSEKTAAWMYFRRYKTRIIEVFSSSKHFGLSKYQLLARAGELALGLGYAEDSRELFNLLPQGSAERETALQLLLRFESNTLDRNRNSYFVALQNTPDWKDRLTLISSFCDSCRTSGPLHDPNRSALDMLLKSLLQWVPKSPEAWRSVGDLIIAQWDLNPAIPGLTKVLIDNAVIFHGPDLDNSLWHAAGAMVPSTKLEQFIHATALLHKYVTNPRLGEEILWKAHSALAQQDSASTDTPWTWRDLIKMAQQWLNNTTFLIDRDRRRGLAALRVAQDGVYSSKEAVENYLHFCRGLPDGFLHAISKTAAAAGQFKFASDLFVELGLTQSFTNKDLLTLWGLASRDESPDLAWRVATILSARESLPAAIKNSWEISGERRTAYTPVILTMQDIEAASSGLSSSAKRFTLSLCILGTKINELALLNGSASQSQPTLGGTSSIEQAIEGALKSTSVIPKAAKSILESRGIHRTPWVAVPIIQSIINSPWLFAVRLLAERLSMPSWGWSIDVLQDLAKTVLPMIGVEPAVRNNAKMARWLSSMTSSERAAWAEIANCIQLQAAETLALELVKFICRLSCILYPSHLTAVTTLQRIRMPLDIIRDIEWFILSEPLSVVRRNHKISNRVAIPENLKKDLS